MAACTPSLPSLSNRSFAESAGESRILGRGGEMTLRISGRGHQGREIRIRSPKCTVGSAPGCTLRLVAPGVGPLQCWIFRGRSRTMIRRMQGAATLNGRHFDESPLKVGDRLRLGAVELELVGVSSPELETAPENVAVANPDPQALSTLQSELNVALDQIKRLEGESRQGFQSSIMAAERAEQLSSALAAAHQQLEETCTEISSAQGTISQKDAEIARCRQELETQRAGEQKWTSLVEQIRREADAAIARCTDLTEDLNQSRTKLKNEQERFQSEQASLRSELNLRDQRIKQRDAEIDSLRSSAEAKSGAMTVVLEELRAHENTIPQAEARIAELEERLRAIREENDVLSRRVIELEPLQRQSDELRAELESARRDVEQARSETEPLRAQLAAATANAQTAAELNDRSQGLDRRKQELTARSSELAAEQQQCACQREQLLADDQRLANQRAELAAERERFADDKNRLTLEQEELARERQEIACSRQQIGEQQQALVSQQEQLTHQQSHLEKSAAQCAAEQEQLAREREQLAAERDDLLSQRQQLVSEREQLHAERSVIDREVEQQVPLDRSGEAALGQQSEQLDRREAELRQQLEAATQRLADLNELFERMIDERASLTDRRQRLDERQSEIEARTQKLDKLAQELQARCQEMENQPIAPAVGADSFAATEAPADPQEEPGSCTPEPSVNKTIVFQDSDAFGHEASPVDSQTGNSPAVTQADWASQITDEPAESNPNFDGVEAIRDGLMNAGQCRSDAMESALPVPGIVGDDSAASESQENSTEHPMIDSPQPATAGATSDDDESIEDYMDRLMKRVRGDSAPQTSWKPTIMPVSEVPASTDAGEAVSVVAEVPSDKEAADYSPRRSAPESNCNLSEMRELANTAARLAIDQHERRITGRQVAAKSFGLLAILVSSALLACWAWRVQLFPAGTTAAVGGAYCLYAVLKRLRSSQRRKELQAQLSAPEPAEPQSTSAESSANC